MQDHPLRAQAQRTLDALREIEATATAEDKQVMARDFRIGGGWPEDLAAEGEALMSRIKAGGVAGPSWGHGAGVLAALRGRKGD